MAFKKRGPAAALVADADHDIGTIYLGAAYARVVGFQARNYASSAKAAAGTDVAAKVRLTDADGIVFYLDAADRDYATALKNYFIEQDDTITGLGTVVVDSTGAAVAAGQQVENVIVKSPVTVAVVNGGTATDYFELYLFVDVGEEATRK
jgi:hypothetical protein